MEIREGGGCVCWFGFPFQAAGMFLVCFGTGVLPLENADEIPRWAPPLIVLMGLASGAAGGELALGRKLCRLFRRLP
jgi:hypothetical protein